MCMVHDGWVGGLLLMAFRSEKKIKTRSWAMPCVSNKKKKKRDEN